MANTADTLCAIEARAERAIVHELRLMMLEILGLRTHLVLEDRTHADGLLLKLDRLEREQVSAPVSKTDKTASLLPSLSVTVYETPVPKAYRVFFYERDYGDLGDVVTVSSFDAGVQLVRNRLALDGDYVIDAAWTRHKGEMTVSTSSGTVLARVEADDGHAPIAQPAVRDACSALQTGETSGIKQLFGRMLEAA
jgi:hypothetical protein